jgi:hypothetical protein
VKFLWWLSAATIPILISVALGVMSMSPPEYELARWATLGAALVIVLTFYLWTLTSEEPLRNVSVVGALACTIPLIAMPITLSWINSVQRSHLALAKEEGLTHPRYVGTIAPSGPNVKFSTLSTKEVSIEIGDSGTILHWNGYSGHPQIDFHGSTITVEVIGGQVKLTTDIRDSSGEIVAELVRNDWKVAPPPKTWDRNYSANAVEVIDPHGKVVIQVAALPDRIRLQGEWHSQDGKGVRLVKYGDWPWSGVGVKPASSIELLSAPFADSGPQIEKMFVYPGDLHLGELRQ